MVRNRFLLHNPDLTSTQALFQYYRSLSDKTFEQLADQHLFSHPYETWNSIAVLVNHLHGNMMSRWTGFMETEGEKSWRNRDQEFEEIISTREELLTKWKEGFNCLFTALESITSDDLEKLVYIRNGGHTVIEAIHRQLAHYSYHIGQIVFIGILYKGEQWQSLYIPKGKSSDFNKK